MSTLSGKKRSYSDSGFSTGGSKYSRVESQGMPLRRKSSYRKRARRAFGVTGGMNLTRNGQPYYFGPSNTLGACAATGPNLQPWSVGPAVASGGLVPGIYDQPFSRWFAMNDIINSSELAAVFDIYKIKKVKLRFSINNYSDAAGTSVASNGLLSMPSLLWFTDTDDAVVPSVESVRERMGVKQRQLIPGKPVNVTVYPRVDQVVMTTPTLYTGAAVGKANQWIDTSNTAIVHNGFKAFFKEMDLRSVSGFAPQYQISVETKYYMSFKHVR